MVEMILTTINNKWDIILPEHRAARTDWDTWEYKRLESMSQKLTESDTLFYIGAEEGDLAALCAFWVKDIFLFEPNPKVWPNIKAIWQANQIEDPYTFVGFASDKSTFDVLDLEKGFPPCADGPIIGDHGFMELWNHNAEEIKIDDIGTAPTALSIDVEGSEWEVLKGGLVTIKRHHPKIWLSVHPEFMFRMYGQYQQDLRNWIKDLGYTETLLDYQHEVHLYYE